MKANYSLIKVLRDAANYLTKHPTSYSWYRTDSCNCGIVAKIALDVVGNTGAVSGTWKDLVDLYISGIEIEGFVESKNLEDYYCSSTNIRYKDVIKQLMSLGFEVEDFDRLERLKDEQGNQNRYHKHVSHLIKWLHGEANRLEVELNNSNKAEVKVPVLNKLG